jgi:hypothetical protein
MAIAMWPILKRNLVGAADSSKEPRSVEGRMPK